MMNRDQFTQAILFEILLLSSDSIETSKSLGQPSLGVQLQRLDLRQSSLKAKTSSKKE